MKRKKSPAKGLGQQVHKDNHSGRIYSTVRALFLQGYKLTAKQINAITGSNDARKIISDLRREGWNIVDLRMPNGCKLYWLAEDVRQGELFAEVVESNSMAV
ncbi:hypothetical protein M2480_001318 [Parabacteroides sp. PFB2-12]|nr:hypothetical protein [Parabacteroides sp. PM6-13]MDH6390345.1 hypothetical protein [Parabacteroides sp. PFB2-12]